MTAATPAGDDDLDFTQHFSPDTRILEPVHSADELKDIDDLGSIGAAALKERGFFARIVTAGRNVGKVASWDTTVLIVEDDEGTATLIRKALEKNQYKTRMARDRKSIAAALAQSPRPDLVLLDVMLPGINGFDVLNRIRQHPALASTAIIMLTSLSDRSDIAKGLGLGADAYLTKPILPSALIDAVRAVHGGV